MIISPNSFSQFYQETLQLDSFSFIFDQDAQNSTILFNQLIKKVIITNSAFSSNIQNITFSATNLEEFTLSNVKFDGTQISSSFPLFNLMNIQIILLENVTLNNISMVQSKLISSYNSDKFLINNFLLSNSIFILQQAVDLL